jgi:hypothetical protein
MSSNAGMLPLAGERGLRASIRRLVTAARRLPCSGSRKRVLWNSEAWPAQPARVRGGEEQRGRALLHCSTTTASSRFGFMESQSPVTVWHLAQTGSPLLPWHRKGKPHSRWRRKCRPSPVHGGRGAPAGLGRFIPKAAQSRFVAPGPAVLRDRKIASICVRRSDP